LDKICHNSLSQALHSSGRSITCIAALHTSRTASEASHGICHGQSGIEARLDDLSPAGCETSQLVSRELAVRLVARSVASIRNKVFIRFVSLAQAHYSYQAMAANAAPVDRMTAG
jgi:hypothetical protein